MSNCVDIKGTVAIRFRDINLYDFMKAIRESSETANLDWFYEKMKRGEPQTDEDGRKYNFYWFLSDRNVSYDSKREMIYIRIGECRSSHTWRDLRGIVYCISRFVTHPFTVNIKMRDIDAPTGWFPATLVFDKDAKEHLTY